MHSIAGYYITRMGGPLQWSVIREKRISGSSCEAEIKAMDEGTKGLQFLRHLMIELGLRDAEQPIPLCLTTTQEPSTGLKLEVQPQRKLGT